MKMVYELGETEKVAISLEEDKDVDALDCWNRDLFQGGELARVAVDPSVQSRGIGRQMMEHGLKALKEL